jgi:hypothetical protein
VLLLWVTLQLGWCQCLIWGAVLLLQTAAALLQG